MEPRADAVVVNAASFAAGIPVAPSALASIGGNFTGSATASFSSVPLPKRLGETEVFIGGESVPLLYASPTQINFQAPSTLVSTQRAIEVRVAGQRVARGSITSVPRSPGLFAVVDQNSQLGRGRRGQPITIFGTGQGIVAPPIADGEVAPASPISRTSGKPRVYVGGREASVTFSGLTPGYVGLWQINAEISQDAPIGPGIDLVVLFDINLVSNPVKITVE